MKRLAGRSRELSTEEKSVVYQMNKDDFVMHVPILLYHQIASPPPRPMPFRSMFVRPKSFARQMSFLKMLGYQGLSLREAIPYIRGEKHGKVAAITFDDGFTNNFENAAPILQTHGFTATNFIVVNQIGGSNLWDQPLGIVKTQCMNHSQISSWLDMGHEIGSHTLDHVNLCRVDDDQALKQIADSRAALEERFGTSIVSFAYPYGQEAPQHRIMAEKAGYSFAVVVKSRQSNNYDLFGMPRATVKRSDTLVHFLKRLRKC